MAITEVDVVQLEYRNSLGIIELGVDAPPVPLGSSSTTSERSLRMKCEPRMIMTPPTMVVGIMRMTTAARAPKAWSRPADEDGTARRPDEEEIDGTDRAGDAAQVVRGDGGQYGPHHGEGTHGQGRASTETGRPQDSVGHEVLDGHDHGDWQDDLADERKGFRWVAAVQMVVVAPHKRQGDEHPHACRSADQAATKGIETVLLLKNRLPSTGAVKRAKPMAVKPMRTILHECGSS